MKQYWLLISVSTISVFLTIWILILAISIHPSALIIIPSVIVWQLWGLKEQRKINKKLEKWTNKT